MGVLRLIEDRGFCFSGTVSSAHHGKIGELSLTSLYTLAEAAQRSLRLVERRLQHGVGGAALLERRPARRQIPLEAGPRGLLANELRPERYALLVDEAQLSHLLRVTQYVGAVCPESQAAQEAASEAARGLQRLLGATRASEAV